MRVKALDRAIPLPVVVSFVAAGTLFFFSVVGMILLLTAAWLSPAHAQDASPQVPQCTADALTKAQGFINLNKDKETKELVGDKAVAFLKALSDKLTLEPTKLVMIHITDHQAWVVIAMGDNCSYGGFVLPDQIMQIVLHKMEESE